MSCDYCEQSGAPTAQTGGLGRAFSRARWSTGRTDVRAWFEERRRQGSGRPMVAVAVPLGEETAAPRSRLPGLPRTAAEAAAGIAGTLAALTGHRFHVAPVDSRPSDPWVKIQGPGERQLTPTEAQLLHEVGLLRSSWEGKHLVWPPETWRWCAVRLQVQEAVQRRLPQFFPCATHARRIIAGDEVLLCETPGGSRPTLIVREGKDLHTLNAAGPLAETFPSAQAASLGLAERRWLAGAVYCPLCGAVLADRTHKTCQDCASADQMV